MSKQAEPTIEERIAADRAAELERQAQVRKDVYDATHNKDGSAKPLPNFILP